MPKLSCPYLALQGLADPQNSLIHGLREVRDGAGDTGAQRTGSDQAADVVKLSCLQASRLLLRATQSSA